MTSRLPEDQWLEVQELFDRADTEPAKRELLEAQMRAQPSTIPHFIASMKRHLGDDDAWPPASTGGN